MNSKIIILSLCLASTLFGADAKTPAKRTTYDVVDPKYDVEKKWWWYEETVPLEPDEQINKHETAEKVKFNVSPLEKKHLDLAEKMLAAQEKNIELQTKILTILEYNFPRRAPEFTTNKKTGERCVSNSSADCYNPLLIPEAQQVPVMAKFLKDPNMDNAKEYLKWQATYFNHMSNIGYGLNFAYRQYGKEAYPTDTVSGLASPTGAVFDSRDNLKNAAVKMLADRLGVYLFLGVTPGNEKRLGGAAILGAKVGVLSYINNFNYIFKNNEDKVNLEKSLTVYENEIVARYNKSKVTINPVLFEKFEIEATPSIIITYTDPSSGKQLWQKIGFNIGVQDTVNDIYNFLLYNGVIQPGTIDEASLIRLEDQHNKDGIIHPDSKMIKTNKNPELNVGADQILNKGTKK